MVIRGNEGGLVVVDRTQKGDCRKLTANQEGSLEYERTISLFKYISTSRSKLSNKKGSYFYYISIPVALIA